MQNGDGSAGRKGGHPIGIGGALLIGGLAWWMERKQDRDHPEAVSLGSKSKLVLDLARELALQSREDNAAVAELVAIARGKRRRLRRARHASKFCGFHHEHWHANRVYRLLDAACLDEPVAAVSGEDRQRIQEVEAMMALPLAQRWELLVEREPDFCSSRTRSARACSVRSKPLIAGARSRQVRR